METPNRHTKTISILIQETEQRISELKSDKLIDIVKKTILIRENKRFLARCQQLLLDTLNTNESPCSCFSKIMPDGSIHFSFCLKCQMSWKEIGDKAERIKQKFADADEKRNLSR